MGYDWAVGATGTMYGLVGDVSGAKEYEDVTTISQADYNSSMTKPETYDSSIKAGTSDQCNKK